MSMARTMNKRGEGGRLREEVIAAAALLLGQVTARDAVTLRAIARQTGIAAPSIYKQFTSRDDVLDSVVVRTFEQLTTACSDAIARKASGKQRIQSISRAYVAFAREHPGEYRILFERSSANLPTQPHLYPEGIALFQHLIDAFEQAANEAQALELDPVLQAQALWTALHGFVTLAPAMPAFPWKADDDLLGHLIDRLSI